METCSSVYEHPTAYWRRYYGGSGGGVKRAHDPLPVCGKHRIEARCERWIRGRNGVLAMLAHRGITRSEAGRVIGISEMSSWRVPGYWPRYAHVVQAEAVARGARRRSIGGEEVFVTAHLDPGAFAGRVPRWGELLHELRRVHGLALVQIAGESGVNKASLPGYERGLENPSVVSGMKLVAYRAAVRAGKVVRYVPPTRRA